MEYVLAVLVLLALVAFVSAPLRRGGAAAASDRLEDPRIAELEARKEAKYREIRDAEMDRAQGKLSEADFRRQDAELRHEAIEVLKELDRSSGAA
jgi:flagellar biosynthesis/type III secretory pathway M-ring protein FliF/YscJ